MDAGREQGRIAGAFLPRKQLLVTAIRLPGQGLVRDAHTRDLQVSKDIKQ